MSEHLGPLAGLIGTWRGDKGLDVAPEKAGPDENPFHETISFEAVPSPVENAESQVLGCVRYVQLVQRKSNDERFHDQAGYWMWDAKTGVIMQSLTIPRAVCVLAGGNFRDEGAKRVFHVHASENDADWGIVQSPFMREQARTSGYSHELALEGDRLAYRQTTMVDIYGRSFEHTDENELVRV